MNTAPPPTAVGGGDAAAMLLGDLADDREPETAALTRARIGAAVEAVEDVGQVVLDDAVTVVADGHAVRVDRDLDRAAVAGVPRRVVQQVVDRADQALGIALRPTPG